MKILIMKFRNIGDVLLTTPLIKNLKLNFPDARIDFALNRGTEAMLKHNPYINEVYVYERNKIKTLPLFSKIKEEIKYVKNIVKNRYDIVINLTRGDRGSIIALLSGADKKIGYPSNKNRFLKNVFDMEIPGYGNRHVIESEFDVIRMMDLKIFEKKVEIFWDKSDEEKVDSLIPEKFVHIHPVSRWLFKCVKDEIMAKIIDFIKNKGYEVVITASPDEKELEKVNSILSHCKTKPLNLSGKLSLNQVACLSSKAKAFVGVDTAVMHMAAAVNTPVVAFFGPSAAFHWGPWDNDLTKSGYVNKNGIQKMGKHTVIQHNWECIPCEKDGCRGSKISECLMEFDMNNIYNILEEKL